MDRIYTALIKRHLCEYRQMAFLSGPRQVGKTTCSKALQDDTSDLYYLNWDVSSHRKLIISGCEKVAEHLSLHQARKEKPVLVFDEIHKYAKWKQFLKGFFDLYEDSCKIIVTGSSRLDIYRRGGDSLMGRYFLYRIHPLTINELLTTRLRDTEVLKPQYLEKHYVDELLHFGGFPEPFLKKTQHFSSNWKRLRKQQLLKEDLRELTKIQGLTEIEYLMDLLLEEAGCQLNIASIANHLNVSESTVKRWVEILKSFFYCYTIKPWHRNVRKAIKKSPKLYVWDWSSVKDMGRRIENFVASHLLKSAQYWTDMGFGDYELFYLRDRDKREVDFLMVKNQQPWFLVEVKASNNKSISKHLQHFYKTLDVAHAFQVVYDMPYVDVDCFSYQHPVIVPISTFLSQLL